MLNSKYALDKSSKKYSCPACNKKTFVRYVDNETGYYLKDSFGRCDRESKCRYHHAPPKEKKYYLIAFLSLKANSEKSLQATETNGQLHFIPKSQVFERNGNSCWITEWWLKANGIAYLGHQSRYIVSNQVGGSAVATVATASPAPAGATALSEPDKTSFHSLNLLDQLYNEEPVTENLEVFLNTIFTEKQVFEAKQNYLLTGTTMFWNKATIFWQIDQNEKIHAGKIMLYDPSTGKRIKKPYNHINWVHKTLKQPDFNLNQCLFGLHRIKEDYSKSIAIVESEKTAIIMSIIVPDVLWLATGSKQNLKIRLLEPLAGRKIVLYPDKGEYEDWKSKAELIKKSGFKVEVSDILEGTLLEPGSDLVDYYISSLRENAGNA